MRRIPWGRIAGVLWVVMFAKNQFIGGLPPAAIWSSLAVDVAAVGALGARIAVWVTTPDDTGSGKVKAAKRLVPILYVLGVLAVIWFTAALIFGEPRSDPAKEETARLLAERGALMEEFRVLAPRAGQCVRAIDEMLVEDLAMAMALQGAVDAEFPRPVVNELLRDHIRLYEGGIEDLQYCMAGGG